MSNSSDNKDKGIKWESLFPHILTIVGMIITVLVFFGEQRALRTMEYRNNAMLLHREALISTKKDFQALAKSLGVLSAVLYTGAVKSQEKAIESFYQQYFGSVFTIAEANLIESLNLLHIDIKNYQQGKVSLVGKIPPKVRIIRSADAVLQAMKVAIEKQINKINEIDKKLLEG